VIITLVLLFAVADIIFVVALFRWQRWGFYGYVVTNVIVAALGLSFGYGKSILGLVGIAILYLALNIGGDRKAWPRLKCFVPKGQLEISRHNVPGSRPKT
jgi:hypothetical protein